MTQGKRMKLAHDIAIEAYNAAATVIDEESTDLGVALAAGALAKRHLGAYVDAMLLLQNKHLQDIGRDDA